MKINYLKRSIVATLIIFMFVLLIQLPSNAAGFSASAGKTSLTTGESTSFTLSVSDALGKFSIASSNPSVVSVSGDTSPWFENTGSTTVTLTAVSAGTATITATAVDASDTSGVNALTGSKTVTITVSNPVPQQSR